MTGHDAATVVPGCGFDQAAQLWRRAVSIRLAGASDGAPLEEFLMRYAEGSMFPLGNLRLHGAVMTDHRRSMEFWISESGGLITGVVGVSRAGFVFPQMPDPHPILSRAVCRAIACRQLHGIIGPRDQAHRLRADLGLDAVPVQHIGDEPQYSLALSGLVSPDVQELHLVGLEDPHRDLVTDWRSQFLQDVIGLEPGAARKKAAEDVEGFIAMNTHRLLFRAGVPVSFTGFNAVLPDIVQVGAVYTPPKLRGKGLARSAVALHLKEARAGGVTRAVLCAANETAARAYQAIGFRQTGDFSMIFFDGPQTVGPCPI